MKREEVITFRVSTEEKSKIESLAKNNHLAAGTYCRQKLLEVNNANQQ